MLLLAWLGRALFAMTFAPDERHIRQRGHYSIARLARCVRALIVVRALQLYKHRPIQRDRRIARMNVQRGFVRRIKRGAIIRALFGAALRKALAARRPLDRIARLINTLRNCDHLARRLIKRMQRTLTRLHPIVLAHAQQDAHPARVAAAIAAINSS